MPLYEYNCRDCDRRFDALVLSPSAGGTVTCRYCAGGNVARLVSTFAVSGRLDDSPMPVRSSGGCCGGSCGCGH